MSSHLFPLPSLSLPYLSSSSSRRCIQRAYRSRSLVLLVNATVGALNYLFNKKLFFKNSQHYHHFNSNSSNNNNQNNSQAFQPTIPQQRVLNHLFKHCKSFYNTYTNTHNNNNNNSNNNDCRRNIFMSDSYTVQRLSFSFLKSFSTPIATLVSPLSLSASHTIDDSVSYTHTFLSHTVDNNLVPSFLSYSSASITAIPLVANKVALPSTLHSLPMLSLLPSHYRHIIIINPICYFNHHHHQLQQQ